MKASKEHILLSHGGGGSLTSGLITDLFLKYFDNKILAQLTDSAVINMDLSQLAFTTDSYVVDPLFFPGGDIGKLAVCGTINDLCVSGAIPVYMSASFILEEGFSLQQLEQIVASMAQEANISGVQIVCGDTKVVEKGKCDKIFINTAGIGLLDDKHPHISVGRDIGAGDKIIINGFIGDHGVAVMGARQSLSFATPIQSDCASLNGIISSLLATSDNIHFMRDATRGGLATVLCELVHDRSFGVVLDEHTIPCRQETLGVCELLGFDPLYIANEGKAVIVVAEKDSQKVLSLMKGHPLGHHSQIIGKVVDHHPGKVILNTHIGGSRLLKKISGEQLPRIC